MKDKQINQLRVVAIGIDTYKEHILYMRHDCELCRSEGFTALTRVAVHASGKNIIATINAVTSDLIHHAEAGLSTMALKNLGVKEGDYITITHLKPLDSLHHVRGKLYGRKLEEDACNQIVGDITANLYSDIELSAFIAACAGDNMEIDEITFLTKAMINSGNRIQWGKDIVPDKHSIGGLPGNRTTPIIVAIVAASGLTIPKTSSRAITSPAGTADTMGTITEVNLSIDKIRHVVEKEGGCFAWGGSVQLSPADDILITVERALDIDSSGQMIASVLSKKAAAGSTHVLIEIPVGLTAKVRQENEALKLKYYFEAVAKEIGLTLEVIVTPGTGPVGRGIGPALEAMDVLKVLRNAADAPPDLRKKSLELASRIFEMTGITKKGEELRLATMLLDSGAALEKFMRICNAQGRFTEPDYARYSQEIYSSYSGTLSAIDNRRLAKVAKLAGAPKAPSAGILMNCSPGDKITKESLLFTLYAESAGELDYALDYYKDGNNIFKIN